MFFTAEVRLYIRLAILIRHIEESFYPGFLDFVFHILVITLTGGFESGFQ